MNDTFWLAYFLLSLGTVKYGLKAKISLFGEIVSEQEVFFLLLGGNPFAVCVMCQRWQILLITFYLMSSNLYVRVMRAYGLFWWMPKNAKPSLPNGRQNTNCQRAEKKKRKTEYFRKQKRERWMSLSFFQHEIRVVRMPNMFILMGMQIKVRNFTDKIYILLEMCVRFCFSSVCC